MKVIRTASGRTCLKLSKKEWLTIGSEAGFIRTSQHSEVRYLTWTPDVNPDMLEVKSPDKIAKAGYGPDDVWEIEYKTFIPDEELFENSQTVYQREYLSRQISKAINIITNETIDGGKNVIERLKILPEDFWTLQVQNDDIYELERTIEKYEIESGLFDTQDVGDYTRYGPDRLKPQY